MTSSSPRAPLGLVYDTGALIAAERNDRRMWALKARALQRGVRPIVPRLLAGCETETLNEDRARSAGILRRGVAVSVGAIEATVAEAAIRLRAAVVTSDRIDLEQLAESARRRVGIIDI